MFLYLEEELTTINKILSTLVLGYPSTVVFGVLFLLLFFLALIFWKKVFSLSAKLNFKTIILLIIAVVWSPIFLDGFFSVWQKVWQQKDQFKSSFQDLAQNRLCAIDNNQKTENTICLLIPFIKEVNNLVPKQLPLAISSDGFYGLFLKYYLTPDYKITSPELANYWLLYLPTSGYEINNEQELIETVGDKKIKRGRWQLEKKFYKGMVILKRL